jgi:hypothetical protein
MSKSFQSEINNLNYIFIDSQHVERKYVNTNINTVSAAVIFTFVSLQRIPTKNIEVNNKHSTY